MSKLKANITANLFGQVLVVVTQIITLPLYLHTLGVEAYGLIGFYVTLQTTIMAFDMGLGSTVNREMAKYNSGAIDAQRAISAVATIEIIFLGLISTLLLTVCFLIPFYAEDILRSQSLQVSDITNTLYMMCALIGLLWMGSIYQNGLMGLEKQVFLSLIKSPAIVLNPTITLMALHIFEPKIQIFFISQIVFTILFIAITRFFFFYKLNIPKNIKPVYSFDSLSGLKKYILGTGLIGAAGAVFFVTDRWILVNKVSLNDFAHYTLALSMSNGLLLFIAPVYLAIFPRFTALINGNHIEHLRTLYSLVSKFLTVLVVGMAIHLSIYAEEIFTWWLRDAEIVTEVYPIAQILLIGTAFNGMMNVPYAMQTACGWIKTGLYITLGLLIVFIPTAIILIDEFGAIGCAIAWTSINFSYLIIGSFVLSKKLKTTINIDIPIIFKLGCLIYLAIVATIIKQFYPADSGFIIGFSFIGVSFMICVSTIIYLDKTLNNHIKITIQKILTSLLKSR